MKRSIYFLLLHPIIPLPPATQPATNLTRGLRGRTSLGPSRSAKLTNLKRLHISILLYLSPRHPPRNYPRLGSSFQRMLPKWRLRERRYSPDCRDKMRGSLLRAPGRVEETYIFRERQEVARASVSSSTPPRQPPFIFPQLSLI